MAELERETVNVPSSPPRPTAGHDARPPPPPSRSHGEAADRLLAEYRRSRDAGQREGRLSAIRRLVSLGERDRSVYLAWVDLLREARDQDEADEFTQEVSEATSPDPGGTVDRKLRAELRELMRLGADPFRRATAAELLFWIVVPQPEDFRAALDAVRTERDEDARIRILGEMGDLSLRSRADPADVAAFRQLLREEIEREHGTMASTLADWSDDPADFDRLRARLEKTRNSNLLGAFHGRRRLTKGREAECRAVLAATAADRLWPTSARSLAVTLLDSFRPWDAATEEAVRRFREDMKPRR